MPRRFEDDDPFAAARVRRRTWLLGALGSFVLVLLATLGFGGLRANAMRASARLAIEEARVHPGTHHYLHSSATDDGYRLTDDDRLRMTLLDQKNSFVVERPYWAITGDCTEVQVSEAARTTRVYLRLERTSRLQFEVSGPSSKGECD